MKQRIWITMMAIGFAAPAAAQRGGGVAQPDAARQELEKTASAESGKQMVGEILSKMAVEARITPDRPYSGEAVTESTQVLADGNRIVQRRMTRIYRDGEGRTRREQIDDSGVVQSVSIVDPVAHTSFVLQPETRTAYSEKSVVSIKFESEKSFVEVIEKMDRAKIERAQLKTEKQREHHVFLPRTVAPAARGQRRYRESRCRRDSP